jgi:hypothetical protein
MSEDHAPELRQLAQAILERLDPAVRMAAARAMGGGQGKCEQVWCPVCAIAALINGEQHPLLTVVAEHSVALLTVVRAMVDTMAETAAEAATTADPPAADDASPASEPGRYQRIPIDVEE